MTLDPALGHPDLYKVIFENDRVGVLEHLDKPGDRTTPHAHPDSVMYTLSTFRRRLLAAEGASRDVALQAGTTGWLPAQVHAGHNVGDTDTHVIFVELKENVGAATSDLGPSGPSVEG